MRCAVIVFPGSNCDSDLYKAVNAFEGVDAEYVWYTTENLDAFDLILLPGGFAYGGLSPCRGFGGEDSCS